MDGEPSPVSATVTQTAIAIGIAPAAIAHLIQHNPKFALEMSQFIDERKKLIRIAQGAGHLIDKLQPTQHQHQACCHP